MDGDCSKRRRHQWKWRRLVALLVAAAPVPDGRGAADVWRPVRGPDLRSAFAAHELADGVHYAYRISDDGTINVYETVRAVRGRWRTRGSEFCWTWLRPAGSEECFTVERQGADIRFLRNGAEYLFRNGAEYLFGKLAPIDKQVETRAAP